MITAVPAMLASTAIIYLFGVARLAHELAIPVAVGKTNATAAGGATRGWGVLS